jgi:hypothetical protein
VTTQTSAWQGEPGTPSTKRAVPGAIIGDRYELRSPIGNGGMGTVWQAVDTVLRRDVAVKEVLFPPGMPTSERDAMFERTLREGRAAAALSHPSVVQVYDVVTEGGRPWIVMELLAARSLSEIIIADGPIAGRAVAKIGIALLGALEVAHVAGVLHRDVKPANVLICADGRCVLTDFGVARMPAESNLTQPGMVLGSPHFISPERAIGAAFGPPSDLFSLGVTLYTAIEGRPPFDRGDPFETMRAIVEDQPVPPVRAGVLAPVLMGLLEKDPARRWTVPQARAALRELISGSLAARPNAALPAAPMARPGAALPSGPSHAALPGATTPMPALLPGVAAPRQLGGRALLDDGESIEDRLRSGGGDPEPYMPSVFEAAGARVSTGYTQPTHRGLQVRPDAPARPAALEKLTTLWRGLRANVMGWPRNTRLGVAGGIAAILVVIIVIAMTSGGSSTGQPAAASPTTNASAAPPVDTQTFHNSKGITVEVPAGWKKASASSYTDFTDPQNSSRKIRINVEADGNDTPTQFLGVAERNLKNPSYCTSPYHRIALSNITLGDRAAAELEYTCGSGTGKRHGIWAATTTGGHAYHFYLTVPDSEFDDSKPIFDEMVKSFELAQ